VGFPASIQAVDIHGLSSRLNWRYLGFNNLIRDCATMHNGDDRARLAPNPQRGINLAQSHIRDKYFVPFGFFIIMAAQFFPRWPTMPC
jgi:hypothetical protein